MFSIIRHMFVFVCVCMKLINKYRVLVGLNDTVTILTVPLLLLLLCACMIICQMDITFVMNRTLEGWRTWFTEPQPNIGTKGSSVVVYHDAIVLSVTYLMLLYYTIYYCTTVIGIMLCRGNAKTVRMFDIAWKDYKVSSIGST